jgi:hypothetical protein
VASSAQAVPRIPGDGGLQYCYSQRCPARSRRPFTSIRLYQYTPAGISCNQPLWSPGLAPAQPSTLTHPCPSPCLCARVLSCSHQPRSRPGHPAYPQCHHHTARLAHPTCHPCTHPHKAAGTAPAGSCSLQAPARQQVLPGRVPQVVQQLRGPSSSRRPRQQVGAGSTTLSVS